METEMQHFSSHPPLRVLVVDDHEDTRETLALLLRMWGHEVRLAHDGPSALEASRDFRPQVVLLDIALPRLNGWEVGRRLRQQEGIRPVLLVAVTGYAREQDQVRSREAGFDAHLPKPCDLEELQRLLAVAGGVGTPV
jgi:CheY-like chemotaxis protein